MGKGKGTISAKDLLGGDSLLEPFELIDRYVRGMRLYPPYELAGVYGAECGCTKCEAGRGENMPDDEEAGE